MSNRDEATAYTVRALAEIGISENTSLLHNPGINHLKLGNMIRSAYEAGYKVAMDKVTNEPLYSQSYGRALRAPRDGDRVVVDFANTVTRKGVEYMYGLVQGPEETDEQFKVRVRSAKELVRHPDESEEDFKAQVLSDYRLKFCGNPECSHYGTPHICVTKEQSEGLKALFQSEHLPVHFDCKIRLSEPSK